MNAFEHVSLLLSFVYALALTHLLSRIGVLLTVRKRTKFSGLLALMMFNCILLVFFNWLALWDLRTLRAWDISTITVQFAQGIVLFGLCSLAAPEVTDEGTEIDLEGFYWEQRPLFYSLFIVGVTLALLANTAFLKTANAALFLKQNSLVIFMMLPGVLALFVRARWAQWAAGVGALLLFAYFTATFEGVIA